jgi:hypothetical protein
VNSTLIKRVGRVGRETNVVEEANMETAKAAVVKWRAREQEIQVGVWGMERTGGAWCLCTPEREPVVNSRH